MARGQGFGGNAAAFIERQCAALAGNPRPATDGNAHGLHDLKQRAVDAAVFMARIEADKQGHVGEIFVEDERGRMVQHPLVSG